MMKSELLGTSVRGNTGQHVKPNVIIGDYAGYSTGDILDANATLNLIKTTEILRPSIDNINNASKIHHGEFNAGNITEEGWYDSITSGRPEGSESDEKYFLYQSSNGGQVCWSRRNSGKTYHRLGKEHPWVATTHDDYSLQHATAMVASTYTLKEKGSCIDWEASSENAFNIDENTELAECYSGDDINSTQYIHHTHAYTKVSLHPNDIIKVRCLYRKGFSAQGINDYPYDSDAYVYLSTSSEDKHDIEVLCGDYIKVQSLGSQKFDFEQDGGKYKNWQDLALIRDEFFTDNTEYGWHYIKVNVPVAGNYFIHISADFSNAGSWLVFGDFEVLTSGVNDSVQEAIDDLEDKISIITEKIPTEASNTNKLIDNNYFISNTMKWGVTRQKQNWTKAADDGYDYTMSNIVYGYIPQANIDLFESAGAVFNEETGYFELNDLKDISYKEMMTIYRECSYFSLYKSGNSEISIYEGSPRTFIYNVRSGTEVLVSNYYRMFSFTETHGVYGKNIFATNAEISSAFSNGIERLRKILISIKTNENTQFNINCFRCPSLEYVQISNLNHDIYFVLCARLNYESIKYLIDNATDSEKTVTVHPTTYDYLIGAAEPTERVGGTSEEWQQLVTDAAEKNISFATK